ncbi:agamous-like MADS-box protein AGL15 [Solanum dulcamara]|uniref:agamous-like MADS-box protein AGL15 n=1 Tax=Solanum dulcamara TaxID=45834 RepID=UPI002485C679|nr:agamous-like MADS-box protein AGL15 [Solanum dulcamara]
MPRKRTRLATSYLDEGKRKKILNERLASLCKKAHDLSILCDVKVAIVSFNPGETEVFAWPSLDEAKAIVHDYLAFPNLERHPKKVVKHVDYLKDILKQREEDIRKLEEIAEEKEMENLFNQLFEGKKSFNEFNVREMKGLLKLIAVKRVKLEQRKIQLNEIVTNDNNAGEEKDGHP